MDARRGRFSDETWDLRGYPGFIDVPTHMKCGRKGVVEIFGKILMGGSGECI